MKRELSGEASESLADALALVPVARLRLRDLKEPIVRESVLISPNGKLVAAFTNDKKVYIWDYRVDSKINQIKRVGEIRAIAWSPDSEHLAVAVGGTVEIWSMQSSEPIKVFDNLAKVRHITFSRKRGLLAAACENGTVHVWRTSDWQPLKSLIHARTDNRLCAISFSPDEGVSGHSRDGRCCTHLAAIFGKLYSDG